MNKLKQFLDEQQAIYNPASDDEILMAQNQLDIHFSDEYHAYLSQIGCFSYEYVEAYGLGISQTSHLNIINTTKEFRVEDGLLTSFVPLNDIGDGHYYIYDNNERNIKVWASPNGGISETINMGLEEFLLDYLKNL